jgi:hypothetical protein
MSTSATDDRDTSTPDNVHLAGDAEWDLALDAVARGHDRAMREGGGR